MMNKNDKREVAINENLGLVHACAKRFKGRGIEYDDLFGAGCLGLVKAVDNFDEEKGFKFSTYAVPVILGEIKRLFRDGGAVKVSRSLKELSLKATREISGFIASFGREPTINELAEILNTTPEKAAEALNASALPVSLSANDDSSLQIDIPTETPEEKLTELLSLEQIIDELDEEDKKLITLRFFKNKTQSQTAEILSTTQVQISRREKKILLAMRKKLVV
ncbi:MAG: sigma-70 family RNA polymerase sigma factor [Acutalibacteraceae bacterium]